MYKLKTLSCHNLSGHLVNEQFIPIQVCAVKVFDPSKIILSEVTLTFVCVFISFKPILGKFRTVKNNFPNPFLQIFLVNMLSHFLEIIG